MAGSLKTLGMKEISSFKRRVIRQHGLGRVAKADHDKLVDLVNQIEAHVIKMQEGVARTRF